MKSFEQVVSYLESLSIMPKSMPGIVKLQAALAETSWFSKIDPTKVIVVAGTNGKGSTCAILQALLVDAGKRVGFYSSPHLIDTTERIRVQEKQISKNEFVQLFENNISLIKKYELTHFEALTLMASDYFFSKCELDYAIFEVGLGGTYDATNAIPHSTSVITALSLDHTNILGSTLLEIAANKFGIIGDRNTVVHHPLPSELFDLKNQVEDKTISKWIQSLPIKFEVDKSGAIPKYTLDTKWGRAPISLLGKRAAENAALALTVLASIGIDPTDHLHALANLKWPGRMQQVQWPQIICPVFLSGDHNVQGVQSLIEIIKDFKFQKLHLIVGIGKDKDVAPMLDQLLHLRNVILYLTETPFKGLATEAYPIEASSKAIFKSPEVLNCLNYVATKATPDDLVVVTGSLYLVGKVLSLIS